MCVVNSNMGKVELGAGVGALVGGLGGGIAGASIGATIGTNAVENNDAAYGAQGYMQTALGKAKSDTDKKKSKTEKLTDALGDVADSIDIFGDVDKTGIVKTIGKRIGGVGDAIEFIDAKTARDKFKKCASFTSEVVTGAVIGYFTKSPVVTTATTSYIGKLTEDNIDFALDQPSERTNSNRNIKGGK